MSNHVESAPQEPSRTLAEFGPAATSLPRLGMAAPAFEAVTTHGKLRLEDFRGNWLVLFSHPADFTPVCTTEFLAFAANEQPIGMESALKFLEGLRVRPR